jgi:DNA-binding response OmpR family regulator
MAGFRALVVDDDDTTASLVAQMIRPVISEVDEALDGETALQLFASHHHAVVILDLHMIGLDGIEVLRRIRAVDNAAKVIILTGFATKESAIDALNLGAFRYLEKPSPMSDLQRVVTDACASYAPRGVPVDETRITALYGRLAALSKELEVAPGNHNLVLQYRDCLDELRRHQEVEAETATRTFRENLVLEPDV